MSGHRGVRKIDIKRLRALLKERDDHEETMLREAGPALRGSCRDAWIREADSLRRVLAALEANDERT